MNAGQIIVNIQTKRAKVLEHFDNKPQSLIATQACGGAHHWARELSSLGHTVRLLHAKIARPLVSGNKTDVTDARAFKSGRELCAWLGLLPKQTGTGGKIRLGSISKRGDSYVRTLLIHGASSVLAHAKEPDPWLAQIKARRPERGDRGAGDRDGQSDLGGDGERAEFPAGLSEHQAERRSGNGLKRKKPNLSTHLLTN